MEILDTGTGPDRDDREPRPDPDRPRRGFDADLGSTATDAAAPPAELDVSPDGEAEPQATDQPAPTPAVRAAFQTLIEPATLAVAALVLELATLGGGYQLMIAFTFSVSGDQSPATVLTQYGLSIGAIAGTAFLLAVAAVLRLRADHPGWTRAAAGAGVIVGVLLGCLAGYFLWRASGQPSVVPGQTGALGLG